MSKQYIFQLLVNAGIVISVLLMIISFVQSIKGEYNQIYEGLLLVGFGGLFMSLGCEIIINEIFIT